MTMNAVFHKKLITNSAVVKEQYRSLNINRDIFNKKEQSLNAEYQLNQMALITKDYWREVDEVTTRVFRSDEGQDLMNDLMGLASNISIGKTVAISRIASDAGQVVRTVGGQVPEQLDKTIYDYSGDPIPIFKTGYGREWREWQGMQSEGFDPLLDDQANVTAALREDMAQYLLTGDPSINVNGKYEAKGITNHPNTIQINLNASGGLNIDLQTAAPDDVVKFFNTNFAAILDSQLVTEKVKLWVSPSIMRNLMRPYSESTGFKGGTVMDYVLQFSKVESISQTFLLSGNNWIGYVRNALYIRPRVAQPVSTYASVRVNPHDNYNFMVWSAMGLQIRKDWNGRSRVFNASGTQPVVTA